MRKLIAITIALTFMLSSVCFAGTSFGGGSKTSSSSSSSTKVSSPAPSANKGSGSFGGTTKPSTTTQAPTQATKDTSASGSFGGSSKPQPSQPSQPSKGSQQSSTTHNYYGGGYSGGSMLGSFGGGLLLGSLMNRPSGYVQGQPGYVDSSPGILGGFFLFLLSIIQLAIVAGICYWVGKKALAWWRKRKEEKGEDAKKFKF